MIPELANYADCPVQFDINRSLILDSGTYGHVAVASFWNKSETPCVAVGPFHDMPALELSTMAVAADFPVITHRAFNLRVTEEYSAPYTTSMYPDLRDSSKQLVSALKILNRTNYVAVVYASSDTGLQRRETMHWALEAAGIETRSFAYASGFAPVRGTQNETSGSIRDAMRAVKKSGYRTIVVATENPVVELSDIADAAAEYELTNGDYVWTWFGDLAPQFGHSDGNSTLSKLLAGSAWLTPFDFLSFAGDADSARDMGIPMANAWFAQGANEIERLKQMVPLLPGDEGYRNVSEEFFAKPSDYLSGFMYDAIVSAGIGACIARNNSLDRAVTTESHVSGIRNVSVNSSASGRIAFGGGNSAPAARNYFSVVWAVLNIQPPGTSLIYAISYLAHGQKFVPIENALGNASTAQFIFADGRGFPPALLRDPPEQNYLSPGVRIIGLMWMSLVVVSAFLFSLWIFFRRKHRLVIASQPVFLHFLCLGAAVFASAIWAISFDESNGLTRSRLDRMCQITPWLVSIGHTVMNGALFTKLSRVHQVLQFARRKVTARHAAVPAVALTGFTFLLMTLWTAIDPLMWTRHETNQLTGESIARCDCKNMTAWMLPLALLMITSTSLVAYFSWHTRDVDGTYSESHWIFIMMIVQIEVVLFAVPMILLLRDVSTDGRYLGAVALLVVIPFSALLLIFLPKMVEYRRLNSVGDNPRGSFPRLRGARGSAGISGLPHSHDHTLRTRTLASSGLRSRTSDTGRGEDSETTAG
jgi:7 transmembrane sweet-taste receptor of 3 GCPR/Receptor family ligand binding region